MRNLRTNNYISTIWTDVMDVSQLLFGVIVSTVLLISSLIIAAFAVLWLSGTGYLGVKVLAAAVLGVLIFSGVNAFLVKSWTWWKESKIRPLPDKKLFSFVAILYVVTVIFALWYAFAIVLNKNWAYDKATRGGYELSFSELVADTWSQKKPRLPTPDQVAGEIWKSTGTAAAKKWERTEGDPFLERISEVLGDKRNLIRHAWLTLSATMLGFVFGTGLGILLAVGIVHNRAMDNSVMPWVITSQTIPILALAPMIIVVLNAVGLSGLIPKAVISAYLSFFPVVVGMVKGLRSPDSMQLDQMRTWFASKAQIFWKLRLPASVPYLFTSLKIGVAASLVGAIVGELTISQDGGLGARMLQGNYYGATLIIWAALIVAAALAAVLVSSVGLAERVTKKRMGFVQ